ncbi:MAG: YggU family protein [Candidatus Aminicenantes bacterium]|nr:YggU family protein [Candidatus Aminicenantes bacterium]
MKNEGKNIPEGLVTVKVQPRAKKREVVRVSENEYKIKVFSPPVKGAANKEVIEVLASYFGLPRSDVRIVRGEKSSRKQVLIGASRV